MTASASVNNLWCVACSSSQRHTSARVNRAIVPNMMRVTTNLKLPSFSFGKGVQSSQTISKGVVCNGLRTVAFA